MRDTCESAGWWWAERGLVLVSARPLTLKRDERNRLHCTDGPAISWADGFAVYAWHGVRVGAQVIEHPETITVEQIKSERNAEVRRMLMERYGWQRFAEDVGAQLINRDDWGTLWELPGGPRVVEVVNWTVEPDGSYKNYWLAVGRDSDTAVDAIASTWRRLDDPRARITGQQYAEMLVEQS